MTSSTLVPITDTHEEALPLLQTHTVTQHTPPPATAIFSNSHDLTSTESTQVTNPSGNSRTSDETLTSQDLLNYFGRWVENGRFFGLLPVAIIDKYSPNPSSSSTSDEQYHQQLEDTVDRISGLAIAIIFHIFFKSQYKKIKSINPLYRNFKTLAAAGTQVGIIFAEFSALSQALTVSIFALGVGIIALPYWFYREYRQAEEERKEEEKYNRAIQQFPEYEAIISNLRERKLQIKQENRNKYTRTGTEGWSKYSKTALVYGMYVGEIVGFITSFIVRSDLQRNIIVYGAFGSVVAFVIGVVAVPVINVLSRNKLVSKTKDGFRNNYVRSGITLGIAVGAVLGSIASAFIPGAGIILAMTVGSAFGSIIGGVTLGMHGHRITLHLQKHWKVKKNTDNSWDYATRNSSYFAGFACATTGFLIGCLIPVPGAALLGSAIGTAVGGVLGWASGLILIRAARWNCAVEHPAVTLPWTQRIANGTMVGSMVGAGIGLCIGLIGGPALAVSGATLGFSLGAVIGGLAFGLYDRTARALIRKAVTGVLILPALPETETPGRDNTAQQNQELTHTNRTTQQAREEEPDAEEDDEHTPFRSTTAQMQRSLSSNHERNRSLDSPEPYSPPRRAASYPTLATQRFYAPAAAAKNDAQAPVEHPLRTPQFL